MPKIKLIMDNLNTHSIASLYQAVDPETARRLAERLEITRRNMEVDPTSRELNSAS